MFKGLFRKQERAALVAIDRQLQEILQLAPEIRDFLQLRHVLDALGSHVATLDALGPHVATLDALGPHVATLDALGPHIATLDALGPHIATLEALGPHIATLDALGPRMAVIDSTSLALTNLDKFTHEFARITNVAEFADLVRQLRPIVDTYLNQNHLVAENVRVDVETVTVLITALQMQINDLQKTISDSRPQ
jgi:hypothetical protein